MPTEDGLSDFGALEDDLGKDRSDRFILSPSILFIGRPGFARVSFG